MLLSQTLEPRRFTLTVNGNEDMEVPAELPPIALNNCVIKILCAIWWDHPFNRLARAIRAEAAHFIVTGIVLSSTCFASIEELPEFLVAFRNLEVG